ncbi:hypothetical protein HBB16_12190 [Pseudonocardia sp. MCCB 268]|nr:hypothetical protein [Pseudonocardia cytotoxica]
MANATASQASSSASNDGLRIAKVKQTIYKRNRHLLIAVTSLAASGRRAHSPPAAAQRGWWRIAARASLRAHGPAPTSPDPHAGILTIDDGRIVT